MSESTSEHQPLITRNMTLRFAIGLLLIAGLIFGYRWFLERGSDYAGLAKPDTRDWIAAIETQPDGGSRVVILKPNGDLERSGSWSEGSHDRDPAWKPDGYWLFFSSDRPIQGKRAFNIYRWTVGNAVIEAKTQGTISRSDPSYSPDDLEEVMMVSGGNVWSLNPKDLTGQKLMPYDRSRNVKNMDASDSTGDESNNLRIRKARWGKDQAHIVAIQRRDTGEALIVQPMTGPENMRVPLTVAAADRIDFDIDRTTGQIYYSLQGFQWVNPEDIPEEFIKNGRAVKPFANALLVFDPVKQTPPVVLVTSKDAGQAFGDVRISPDGSLLAVVSGQMADGILVPNVLAALHIGHPEQSPSVYARGEVSDPSWSPDGTRLAYVKREGPRKNLYVARVDGTEERIVSDGEHSYSSPVFSPQR